MKRAMCRELGKTAWMYVWVYTYTEEGRIKQNGNKAATEQHLAHTASLNTSYDYYCESEDDWATVIQQQSR